MAYIRPLDTQIAGFKMRMNIENEMLLVDLPQLDQAGADGIGLFRTEFQFMVSEFMPRLKEQTELYRKAIEAAGDRPVTFRTLDLGGDKILPYMDCRKKLKSA